MSWKPIQLAALVLFLQACSGAGGDGGATTVEVSQDGLTMGGDTGPAKDGSVVEGDDGVPLLEGGFGWPCQANTECTSEWCVESAAGRVCTVTCIDSCPAEGWDCKAISNVGTDLTFVCVDPQARLCWPCAKDDDCESPTADPGARCVDHGDAGSFCGIGCTKGGSCPKGHACQEVDVAGGGAASMQCVPTGGECACSKAAVDLKLSTTCSRSGEAGICKGSRTCQAAGLTDCSAAVPAVEVCDGADNDCDGTVDGASATDCVTYFPDADGDGYGIGKGECLCTDRGSAFAKKGGDCNDLDTGANPGAKEKCNFGDDDCDGETDEEGALGCVSYFPDADADGYGGEASEQCTCAAPGGGYILVGGDCEDTKPGQSPGVAETCNGIDDDCDGETDEKNAKGCMVFYVDADGDGYGQSEQHECRCAPGDTYAVKKGGDCDDTSPLVHPLALEICNKVDDDCDGEADQDGTQGCASFYKDADEDGFGDPDQAGCYCGPKYPFTAMSAGDCDDSSAAALPGGTEVCDGLDNDCDGGTDTGTVKGCTEYFWDADGDGYGTGKAACMCAPDGLLKATLGGDCDDTDAKSHPGGQESCSPGDENCNGQVDEPGALGCVTLHKDVDGDGFGVAESACVCGGTPPFTASKAGDCYDQSTEAFPGQGKWFTTHRGDGGFDYDCDGAETRRWTQKGGHCDTFLGFCSSSQYGFVDEIPECGKVGKWLYDCDSGFFSCKDKMLNQTQECH